MSAKKPPRPYSERMATDPTRRRAHKKQVRRDEAAARQVIYNALTPAQKAARNPNKKVMNESGNMPPLLPGLGETYRG